MKFLMINVRSIKDIGNVPVYMLYTVLSYADGDRLTVDKETMRHLVNDFCATGKHVERILEKFVAAGILTKMKTKGHFKVNCSVCSIQNNIRKDDLTNVR